MEEAAFEYGGQLHFLEQLLASPGLCSMEVVYLVITACRWICHQIWNTAQPPVCELGDALPSPHHKNQYIAKCYTGLWTFMHFLK